MSNPSWWAPRRDEPYWRMSVDEVVWNEARFAPGTLQLPRSVAEPAALYSLPGREVSKTTGRGTAVSQHPDPQQMIEYMHERAGAFMRILGGHIEAIDQQRGWARLRWHPTEACCHSGTIVQGGFVTSMLDAAMAHAITARIGAGMMAPTLDLNVSFFRVCNPGPHFSEGSVVHCTRSVAFAEALLTDASGTPIARATGTCKIAPLKG